MSRRYLSSCYGQNIPVAIKCAKFQLKEKKPFTSADIGVNGQMLRNLAFKGIIIPEKRKPGIREYTMSPDIIKYLKERQPEEFKKFKSIGL